MLSPFNAAVAGLRGFGLGLRPVLEAPAFIAGFDDLAMMGEAFEERCCHLGIPKDARPFAEGQIGGDDNRGAFVELADPLVVRRMLAFSERQVEQQLTAGLGEG